jgi:hypothetical protein
MPEAHGLASFWSLKVVSNTTSCYGACSSSPAEGRGEKRCAEKLELPEGAHAPSRVVRPVPQRWTRRSMHRSHDSSSGHLHSPSSLSLIGFLPRACRLTQWILGHDNQVFSAFRESPFPANRQLLPSHPAAPRAWLSPSPAGTSGGPTVEGSNSAGQLLTRLHAQ